MNTVWVDPAAFRYFPLFSLFVRWGVVPPVASQFGQNHGVNTVCERGKGKYFRFLYTSVYLYFLQTYVILHKIEWDRIVHELADRWKYLCRCYVVWSGLDTSLEISPVGKIIKKLQLQFVFHFMYTAKLEKVNKSIFFPAVFIVYILGKNISFIWHFSLCQMQLYSQLEGGPDKGQLWGGAAI